MNVVCLICGKWPPRTRYHGVTQEHTSRRHTNAVVALYVARLFMSIKSRKFDVNGSRLPLCASILELLRSKGYVIRTHGDKMHYTSNFALQISKEEV